MNSKKAEKEESNAVELETITIETTEQEVVEIEKITIDPMLTSDGKLNEERFQIVKKGLMNYLSIITPNHDSIYSSIPQSLNGDVTYVEKAINEGWSRIYHLHDDYTKPLKSVVVGSRNYGSRMYVLYTSENLSLDSIRLLQYAKDLKFDLGKKIAELTYYYKNVNDTARAVFEGGDVDSELLGIKMNKAFEN